MRLYAHAQHTARTLIALADDTNPEEMDELRADVRDDCGIYPQFDPATGWVDDRLFQQHFEEVVTDAIRRNVIAVTWLSEIREDVREDFEISYLDYMTIRQMIAHTRRYMDWEDNPEALMVRLYPQRFQRIHRTHA